MLPYPQKISVSGKTIATNRVSVAKLIGISFLHKSFYDKYGYTCIKKIQLSTQPQEHGYAVIFPALALLMAF